MFSLAVSHYLCLLGWGLSCENCSGLYYFFMHDIHVIAGIKGTEGRTWLPLWCKKNISIRNQTARVHVGSDAVVMALHQCRLALGC